MLRIIRVKKDDDVVIVRKRRPSILYEPRNVFVDSDNICDDCEFRFNCPVARLLRGLRSCY